MEQDPAEALQARLRADLKAAMRERKSVETRVLRVLVAAIDDAQAVPVGDWRDTHAPRAFGDASVEVSRLSLSPAELTELLRREWQDRTVAAEQMASLGQQDRAQTLCEEAAIVERYLSSD